MSQINVNRIKDSNEGAPDFPSGVNVSGVTSTVTLGVTNLNTTNLNVSGVVTATTLDGSLPAAGTPTLGLGVTINTSGLNISGVATAGIVSATTLYGDGTNITGIALTIAPLNYNPALNSQSSHLTKALGIGLTFNQGVKAGSGNVTLSLANAGVAGTVVENFSVGSSVSYPTGDSILITPTADLNPLQNYHLSYPSGAFTNIGGDVSYVGTAYTFQGREYNEEVWIFGRNPHGNLGLNNKTSYSSPVQIPGLTWGTVNLGKSTTTGLKTDGTLWTMGDNTYGELGQNNRTYYSSPVQIPGTTWSSIEAGGWDQQGAIRTDGTLWMWGQNQYGELGLNQATGDNGQSSPTQVPGTTWRSLGGTQTSTFGTKTDGTLWAWGRNWYGQLGQNNRTNYSSPVQIPGTTWGSSIGTVSNTIYNIKTDGTLWVVGRNTSGQVGNNSRTDYSSPIQIPGTTWSQVDGGYWAHVGAVKTDGTLWSWGYNYYGQLGQNQGPGSDSSGLYSSPVQIPGTTWAKITGNNQSFLARRTDGTVWSWGSNTYGQLGLNNRTQYSSPVQIPGTWSDVEGALSSNGSAVVRKEV